MPPIKNCRILLEQSFTAYMSLLTPTSTSGWRRRCDSSLQWWYLHHLHTMTSNIYTHCRKYFKIKKEVCLLFMTTPYCDASFGSCFKSSFNFDNAACEPTLQIIRPIDETATVTGRTNHSKWKNIHSHSNTKYNKYKWQVNSQCKNLPVPFVVNSLMFPFLFWHQPDLFCVTFK